MLGKVYFQWQRQDVKAGHFEVRKSFRRLTAEDVEA